ncbi:hypothetical protein CEY12_14435 [Chryseobacterium sp. T16E-39]|uniref:hypothetical protein n=1 Tax=Chryseobacterium sp. T16E-39 TaxID=2015076 RepID=UPI000B5B3DC0|nr:hypothetical protein [Chryseobacterium sp. T16E-39]ASK31225.1 hypothetical protein CEY12_14435 [Chryseobacterium sp. T16E-39]
MRKLLLFFLFSLSVSAQKIELIKLTQNIKDRSGMTKSLTLIDQRMDTIVGKASRKNEKIEVKFADGNLNKQISNWFDEDNKVKGKTDIVLILEELKVYDEQDPDQKNIYGKAKIKISSFIKRNGRYYFLDRFDSIIVSDPQRTSSVPGYLSDLISSILTQFINLSYTSPVSGLVIPESEIGRYDEYLRKSYKAFNNPILKDGVYKSFKSFYNQEPEPDHYVEKNKKGKVVRVKNKGELVSINEVFCYVEGGKGYLFTPVGFLEMEKDDKGFLVASSRAELIPKSRHEGVVIGAVAGGLVGAIIGSAIDSGSNPNKDAIYIGFASKTFCNVYLDSITGSYIFSK